MTPRQQHTTTESVVHAVDRVEPSGHMPRSGQEASDDADGNSGVDEGVADALLHPCMARGSSQSPSPPRHVARPSGTTQDATAGRQQQRGGRYAGKTLRRVIHHHT